ncbi:MAG: hypothetical protein ACI4HK_08720 [Ruminococcus sp.]
MTFLMIALIISILANVIMAFLLYKAYCKYSTDKTEKHMLFTMLTKEQVELKKEQADEDNKKF